MTCVELQDVIVELAAGTADDAGARALRAHLFAGCPVCTGRLAEIEAIAGQIPLALTPVPPPARLRARLMERVAADSKEKDDARVVPFPSGRAPAASWTRPAVAAALAAGIAAAAVYVPLSHDRDAMSTALARQEERVRAVEGDLRAAADTLRVLRSPAVQVVSLGGGEPQPGARGRIFWDRARGEWRFYAAEMRPPGAGRTYELWLINDKGTKIPAGTFEVDASGEGELRVAIPADAGTVTVAAVTDEPAGGSAQPTGSIQLVGKIEPIRG
jgi:hypothetical protein